MKDTEWRTLAIIPAWQEEKSIAGVIAGVRRYISDVLVVDDCSTDCTGEVARATGAYVVRHPINLGYGAAVLTGFLFAERQGYKQVVYLDADGQHDPADIPTLLAGLESGDICIGSRFMGESGYKMPVLRQLGNQFFSKIAQKLAGCTITDCTSGFRAVSRQGMKFYNSQSCPDDVFDADMLVLAARSGCVIVNVQVTMRANTTGKSMHGGIIKPLYYIARMMIGLLCAAIQTRKAKP